MLCHFDLWRSGDRVAEVSHMGTACPCDCPSFKILDTKAWVSFLGWEHFTRVVRLLLGELSAVCGILLGDNNYELCSRFLLDLTCAPFPFADSNLYPSSVINYNREWENF